MDTPSKTLRPLRFREPGQLVVINELIPEDEPALSTATGERSALFRMASKARSFSEMGIIDAQNFSLTGHVQPEQVNGARVAASVLPMLGGSRCWAAVHHGGRPVRATSTS